MLELMATLMMPCGWREFAADESIYLVNSINPFVSKGKRQWRRNCCSNLIGRCPITLSYPEAIWETARRSERLQGTAAARID